MRDHLTDEHAVGAKFRGVEVPLLVHPVFADYMQAYGAGIASSNSESVFALDNDSPHRLAFDLKRVMRTKYRIDDFQRNYFVIDSFEQLLEQTLETDFARLCAELATLPAIEVASLLPEDRLLTRGTGCYEAAVRARQ